MVFILSLIQAPIQSLLRPAMWIPVPCGKLHSCKEIWTEEGLVPSESLERFLAALQKAQESSPKRETYDMHTVDKERKFVRLFAFTRAEWLDVVEIDFAKGEAYSFSSGLFPLWIPFAFLLNCAFFWVPFFDNGFNQDRLQHLRAAMSDAVLENA